jgi:hypothetical protein
MEEGFQATEVCSALFSLLLGQASVDEPPAQTPAGKSGFPNELPDHEGFAQPKGFKKPKFQPRDPAPMPMSMPQGLGHKKGFQPAFKPSFDKGKPAKFTKGFKKDRGPR